MPCADVANTLRPEAVISRVKAKGWARPADVQAITLPIIRTTNHNIIVQSPAGSGKTGCFALAQLLTVASSVAGFPNTVQCVCVTPTHLLTGQVASVIAEIGQGTKVVDLSELSRTQRKIKNVAASIVVGTPEATRKLTKSSRSGKAPLDLSKAKVRLLPRLSFASALTCRCTVSCLSSTRLTLWLPTTSLPLRSSTSRSAYARCWGRHRLLHAPLVSRIGCSCRRMPKDARVMLFSATYDEEAKADVVRVMHPHVMPLDLMQFCVAWLRSASNHRRFVGQEPCEDRDPADDGDSHVLGGKRQRQARHREIARQEEVGDSCRALECHYQNCAVATSTARDHARDHAPRLHGV